jgi:hypothetical protein
MYALLGAATDVTVTFSTGRLPVSKPKLGGSNSAPFYPWYAGNDTTTVLWSQLARRSVMHLDTMFLDDAVAICGSYIKETQHLLASCTTTTSKSPIVCLKYSEALNKFTGRGIFADKISLPVSVAQRGVICMAGAGSTICSIHIELNWCVKNTQTVGRKDSHTSQSITMLGTLGNTRLLRQAIPHFIPWGRILSGEINAYVHS